jgi:RNA polymerase sigma-19 factor, ECF subfamily
MSSEPAQSTGSAAQLAESIFRSHTRDLQRFLMRRVDQIPDADDLAQEIFARLLRVQDADLVRKPRAYLLGIAAHVVREFRQRKQQDPVVFDSDVTDEICANPEQIAMQGLAEHLDLQTRLDRAFLQLPPTHRLVLLLVKRDGLSYAEAAQTAGLSVHTIEKYVVEARASLRVILAES